MKAVCVLVCLALARHAAGSIFHRRAPANMERYIAQSQDYVDPYLQELEYPRYRSQYPYAQPLYRYKEHERKQERAHQESRQERERMNQMYDNQDQDQEMERVLHKADPERPIARETDSAEVPVENNSQAFIKFNSLLGFDTQYAAPVFADMGVTYNAALPDDTTVLSGDAVVWRGVQMANGPLSPVEQKDIEKIYGEAMKTMKHIQPEAKADFHNAVEISAKKISEEARLNATELLKKHQYPVEEHNIKTDDGYYLTLFRISAKRSVESKPRPVVFLMHGLLGSADDWLLMGPGKSLAYLLADAGYDVWLGNARGNKYTRHVSKSRAQPDFWQYSNDEIALHDLPAMIDYVLLTAGVQKMVFVGHSSGSTDFFALASARPEYNNKIVKMYALAPMAYMNHVRSPLVRMIEPTSQFYSYLHEHLGHGEFRPNEELVRTIGGEMCQSEIGCKKVCSNVYFVMTGVNVQELEAGEIPSIMAHLPAGGSTKQMKQFGQIASSNEFRMYDYGAEMNEKVYGQAEPPKYEMKKLTTPVVLYYSEADWLAHPKDVERLQKELPNATAKKIPEVYFTHNDFIGSKKAPEQVYKHLIETIQKNKLKAQEEQ